MRIQKRGFLKPISSLHPHKQWQVFLKFDSKTATATRTMMEMEIKVEVEVTSIWKASSTLRCNRESVDGGTRKKVAA